MNTTDYAATNEVVGINNTELQQTRPLPPAGTSRDGLRDAAKSTPSFINEHPKDNADSRRTKTPISMPLL